MDGQLRSLLVHRKGSTRAFPPHHPLIPVDYQLTGQPVLIGGTMGTCSYVLTGGTQGGRAVLSLQSGSGRAAGCRASDACMPSVRSRARARLAPALAPPPP